MSTTLCQTTDGDNLAEITKIDYTNSIMEGHTWIITVNIKDTSWIFGDSFQLYVIDKDTDEILAFQTFAIDAGKSKIITVTGIMPNKSLKINVSLIRENVLANHCEDYREFVIKLATTSQEEQTTPGTIPENSLMMYAAIAIGILVLIVIMYLLLMR